jgi:hypothetical protein
MTASSAKTLTLTAKQLFQLLDAMESYDVAYHSDGDEAQVKDYDKLYKRLLAAYQKIA